MDFGESRSLLAGHLKYSSSQQECQRALHSCSRGGKRRWKMGRICMGYVQWTESWPRYIVTLLSSKPLTLLRGDGRDTPIAVARSFMISP